jgi:hypothetical protein
VTFRFGFEWFPVALDSYKINYSGIGVIYSDLNLHLGEMEGNFRIADDSVAIWRFPARQTSVAWVGTCEEDEEGTLTANPHNT